MTSFSSFPASAAPALCGICQRIRVARRSLGIKNNMLAPYLNCRDAATAGNAGAADLCRSRCRWACARRRGCDLCNALCTGETPDRFDDRTRPAAPGYERGNRKRCPLPRRRSRQNGCLSCVLHEDSRDNNQRAYQRVAFALNVLLTEGQLISIRLNNQIVTNAF